MKQLAIPSVMRQTQKRTLSARGNDIKLNSCEMKHRIWSSHSWRFGLDPHPSSTLSIFNPTVAQLQAQACLAVISGTIHRTHQPVIFARKRYHYPSDLIGQCSDSSGAGSGRKEHGDVAQTAYSDTEGPRLKSSQSSSRASREWIFHESSAMTRL